jgi:cellulose synthase/poly-beta-1,6-N-acetylglucosamine synthase-like glycosyltransferase
MEFVIFSISAFYILWHLILFIGLMKSMNMKQNLSWEFNPSVSIIVAARNEEPVIRDCIESLVHLDFPYDKLEIILVNDRSDDHTGVIMQSYEMNYNFVKYICIQEEHPILKGKTNALNEALNSASGEIIFTTDADIKVKKTWLRTLLSYYTDECGVVSSYSIIEPQGLFSGVQSLDWMYMLTTACASFGMGIPISCVGNNMSYRRKAYDETGGYSKINFSVTEDFILLQEIRKKTKWKTSFPVNAEGMNITQPCASISELLRQKKRWIIGGLGSFSAGIPAGALSWFSAAFFLFGWLITPELWLIFITVKFVTDCLFMLPALRRLGLCKYFIWFIPYEIYFILYVLPMPFVVLFSKKVKWKGREL